MTATPIQHRPAPLLAAAAAVAALAAIAAGTVVFAVSHDDGAPGQPAPVSVQAPGHVRHLPPTTAGGRVMLGQ